MDVNSLAHTKWECKYHIVFAPKYRRQVIYKDIRADVGQILGTLCRRKGIEIIEAECCPDHIHMQSVDNTLLPCPKRKKTKNNFNPFIRPAFRGGLVFVLFVQPV